MSLEEFIVFTTTKLEFINGELSELPLLRAEIELVKIRLTVLEVQLTELFWWFRAIAIGIVGLIVTQLGQIYFIKKNGKK